MSSTIAVDPVAVRQAIAVLSALLPAPVAPPIRVVGRAVPAAPATHLRDRVLRCMRTQPRMSAPELRDELEAGSVAVARGLVVKTNELAPKTSSRGRAPRYYRAVRQGRKGSN
jgi:hypothetical protein